MNNTNDVIARVSLSLPADLSPVRSRLGWSLPDRLTPAK